MKFTCDLTEGASSAEVKQTAGENNAVGSGPLWTCTQTLPESLGGTPKADTNPRGNCI